MIRLDRLLVSLSVGSRTEVQRLIRSGKVFADGVCVTDPAAQVAPPVSLAVNGQAIDSRTQRHILLNKPAGILTAARDRKQSTVMDLLPEALATLGCMPVGRLDKDTTGLLFFTTDGELNHRLLSPGRHVDKTYYAEVDGPLGPEAVEAFARGIPLEDFTAAPAELCVLSSGPAASAARVTVREGKFHQVKRMFEAVGLTVTRLHRERFGPLVLPDDLPEGAWRDATEEELTALRRCVRLEGCP